MFFFEKKNQKTFVYGFARIGAIASSADLLHQNEGLFASFSAEKEEFVFLHVSKMHDTL